MELRGYLKGLFLTLLELSDQVFVWCFMMKFKDYLKNCIDLLYLFDIKCSEFTTILLYFIDVYYYKYICVSYIYLFIYPSKIYLSVGVLIMILLLF